MEETGLRSNPVYVNVGGKISQNDGRIEKSNHAVVAVGYITIDSSTSVKTSKMLLVQDEWYTNRERFMDFNPTSLTSIHGRAIWIK